MNAAANNETPALRPIHSSPPVETSIPLAPEVELKGFLEGMEGARGLILFVHGSGSSRFSRRNHQVAKYLRTRRFATLLMDLLTTPEEQQDAITRELRFNIPLLAQRVTQTLDWMAVQPALRHAPVGLFGASTGAAAALIAAASRPVQVKAVVSRGGRPDLAGDAFAAVHTPTLLIVGGADEQVLELNRTAAGYLPAPSKLVTVPGATHLFEEAGALEEASRLAAEWFEQHVKPRRAWGRRRAKARAD